MSSVTTSTIFFFDLDGPILDVSERYYQAYAETLAEWNVKPLVKDEYWELKRRRVPDYEILRKTALEEQIDQYKTKRNILIEEEHLLELDTVWPELREVYDEMGERHPVILVTLRTRAERVIAQLKRLGIYDWFRDILSDPAHGVTEERWRVKVNLVNKLDVAGKKDMSTCFFVGDTETDILAGKRLGMKTIAVSFGIRAPELLASLTPDYIFTTPAELEHFFKSEAL